MSAQILDGKAASQAVRETVKNAVLNHKKTNDRAPGLAVIQVGEDPASTIYVNNKRKACEAVGFQSFSYTLEEKTSEQALLDLIISLNENVEVDGILVQLPLPQHINSTQVIEQIAPHKDVDGFHPYNLGRLAQRIPLLRPCTPYGIIQLFKHHQIEIAGKHAVVVGASNIVGRPLALELLLAKATVTICHRFTKDLQQHIKSADIVVSATGVTDIIKTDWLQPHQIVVDVGIHRLEDGTLHGDIDFATAKDRVQWISPVPGGVGPMTISTLLLNTLQAYEKNMHHSSHPVIR